MSIGTKVGKMLGTDQYYGSEIVTYQPTSFVVPKGSLMQVPKYTRIL